MGWRYKSWEEKQEAKKARVAKRTELRKQSRGKASAIAKRLMSELVSKMKATGFSNLKLEGYSGVCGGTIGRLIKRRDLDKATFIAVVGMARAAGYKIQFVRLSSQEDEYYDERTVKLSEVDKLKSKQ